MKHNPNSVNAKDILRICVIGAECTGKSTLSKALAEHYSTNWVPEYARTYLEKLRRPYNQDDLLKIANGQIRIEDEWIRDSNRLVIMDTNLLVIKVWSEHKYGVCDPGIILQHEQRHYDHYLLTDIDIPWENDPQREHPQLREHFGNLYHQLIKITGVPFTLISGAAEERMKKSIDVVEELLQKRAATNPAIE